MKFSKKVVTTRLERTDQCLAHRTALDDDLAVEFETFELLLGCIMIFDDQPDADYRLLKEGFITVTPIQLDLTDYEAQAKVAAALGIGGDA